MKNNCNNHVTLLETRECRRELILSKLVDQLNINCVSSLNMSAKALYDCNGSVCENGFSKNGEVGR